MSAPARIDVALGDRSYPILIEAGLFDRAGAVLKPFARTALPIITDEHVWAAQGQRFLAALAAEGVEAVPIILPPGETTKSWSHLAALIDKLLELGVERSGHIVAFGGGVIGDLAGFAAAILKRGCNFIQVPTTLLAQVDSSVGGKTAIDVPAGKNLVGAFHQPVLVLIDPICLETLPQREVRSGYAEVVKYGLINDPDFFAWCEANGSALLDGDLDARTYAISKASPPRPRSSARDERETSGRRALLNLGHTFGHALEAETGYSDRLLHGEAVALGMALAFRFSAERGICGEECADPRHRPPQYRRICQPSLGAIGMNVPGRHLVDHMAHDKKMSGGTLPFILASGVGRAFVDTSVRLDDVAAFLDSPAAREG